MALCSFHFCNFFGLKNQQWQPILMKFLNKFRNEHSYAYLQRSIPAYEAMGSGMNIPGVFELTFVHVARVSVEVLPHGVAAPTPRFS